MHWLKTTYQNCVTWVTIYLLLMEGVTSCSLYMLWITNFPASLNGFKWSIKHFTVLVKYNLKLFLIWNKISYIFIFLQSWTKNLEQSKEIQYNWTYIHLLNFDIWLLFLYIFWLLLVELNFSEERWALGSVCNEIWNFSNIS